MRVIARIPDLTAPRVAGPVIAAAHSMRPVMRSRGGLLANVAEAWPTWPVAALAAIAIATWALASWNDHARLERQRAELRLAREPAARQTVVPTGTSAGGAVVR